MLLLLDYHPAVQQNVGLTTELAFLPLKRLLNRRAASSAAGIPTTANAVSMLDAKTGIKPLRLGLRIEMPGTFRAFSTSLEMALPVVPVAASSVSSVSGPSSSAIFWSESGQYHGVPEVKPAHGAETTHVPYLLPCSLTPSCSKGYHI